MFAKLPECPESLPEQIASLASTNITSDVNSQALPEVSIAMRESVGNLPSAICGSTRTPAVFWLAAIQAFPDSDLVCFEETTGNWRDLRTMEAWNPVSGDTNQKSADREAKAETEQSDKSQVEEAPPARRPESQTKTPKKPKQKNSQRPDSDIISKAFLYTAWGLDNIENEREVEKLKEMALQRSRRNPKLPGMVNQATKRGQMANKIWDQAQRKLSRGGESPEFIEWFEKVQEGQHPSLRKHLSKQFDKWRKWKNGQKAASRKDRQTGGSSKPTLRSPRLSDNNAHPNSLPHLTPAAAWQVVIDETGDNFSHKADDMNYQDKKLGRVVALVVPEGKNLPPLRKGFHATNESVGTVDAVVQTILDSKVGVFGFSLNDPGKPKSYSWFSAIHTLLRWVVRQIPFEEGRPKKVNVSIEQRGTFNEDMDLGPVAETLEAEMRDLDPDFFCDLKIRLRIITKEGHPLNGYIDAIGNTWGGGHYAKERMKQTKWPGHCLLHPKQENLNRVLLWLDGHSNPAPADWLDLMQQLGELPESAFINRYLDRVGERVRQDPDTWQNLLNEVQEQLRKKTYSLDRLSPAIDWLERYSPECHQIPKPLRLQWLSARLANSNHLGQLDKPAIQEILELGNRLLDECAPEVTQAWLRVSVAATNAMDFNAAKAVLESLHDLPDSTIGLTNRGKYWSSLGQIAAFQHQHAEAIAYFDRALETFGRLSDPQEAEREQLQTRIYKLIAIMDSPGHDDGLVQAELESMAGKWLNKKDLGAALRSLAYRGDESRWLHHLFLRAMTVRPDLGQRYMDHYLQQAQEWQGGVHHPWPLIDAYRAIWLNKYDQRERASDCLDSAIQSADEQSEAPILSWMASVLSALGVSLGLRPAPAKEHTFTVADPTQSENLSQARQQLETADTHAKRINAFDRCLPFNFH